MRPSSSASSYMARAFCLLYILFSASLLGIFYPKTGVAHPDLQSARSTKKQAVGLQSAGESLLVLHNHQEGSKYH